MPKHYSGRSEKGQHGYKSPKEHGKEKGGNHQMGHENGSMPNHDMAMAGLNQGDMSPRIKDYQKPSKDFSQEGFNKTLEYINRQDRFQGTESTTIEQQAYHGRYS